MTGLAKAVEAAFATEAARTPEERAAEAKARRDALAAEMAKAWPRPTDPQAKD